VSVTIYRPVATLMTCQEDNEYAVVMLDAYRQLERENAALREGLQSIWYMMPRDEFLEDHDAAAVSTFKQIKKILKDARKEAQP